MSAIFAAAWACNFALGWFRPDDVRAALIALRERPWLVTATVIALLSVDSLLAVPTVLTVLLAGHVLGPWWGGAAAGAGLLSCGSVCFWGARHFGLTRWVSPGTIERVRGTVRRVGPLALLTCRALPLLPEVLSALSGLGAMDAKRYYLYFSLGSLPFAFTLAYAGSISSFERPWPALIAACAIPATAALVMLVRRTRMAR